MSLEGVNVLVDGYNLELTHGTGIKTYGISLVSCLKSLKANVSILSSKKVRGHESLLKEVLFFDNQNSEPTRFDLLKANLRLLSKVFAQAELIPLEGVVLRGTDKDLTQGIGKIYNFSFCYEAAHMLNRLLGCRAVIDPVDEINIWHTTYPLPIKIKGAKKITTIHDLIPLRLPFTTLDNKKAFFRNVRASLQDSCAVITVSEASKKDMVSLFELNPEKIFVTYQPTPLRPLSEAEAKASFVESRICRYGLSLKEYILFVGAIEPKKNVGRLIDAYISADTHMPLVIVGKKGWLWEKELSRINKLPAVKEVLFLEYLPSDDLRYLYSGAYCLVFPSLYEGFGLPPLEAMLFGCPVITSHTSSLPEVCGDAALYVNPYKTDDIQAKIDLLLKNPNLCSEFSLLGLNRAKLFSSEIYSKRILEVYNAALNR